MQIADSIYTANMTPEQRNWFYAEYQRASKDEIIGVLLALFLGNFGIHHFYLRRDGAGILYLLFCWTGIPAIIGFFECFFMPGRVRRYNAAQAAFISAQIHASPDQPLSAQPPSAQYLSTHATLAAPPTSCPSCASPVMPTATFCTHCGSPISGTTAQPAG